MLQRGRVLALLAVGSTLWAAGCDRKAAVTAAPPSSALPPLDPSQAAPAAVHDERPMHAPSGAGHPGGLPSGHPPIAPGGAMAASAQATPGNIEFDKKTVVSGVLRLDDKVKGKVAAGDVIYLVARNAETPGPPLAVKRLTVASWPLTFALDSRDAMFEGTQMKGKIIVQVRVDKDGDAATKTPGDITGVSRAIELPADKVIVTLDTVL